MDRMSERALDLLRRNRKRLGRSIQHHADALPARAKLPDALEQALRVAHRRHVGIGDQEHLIGRVQRRHRAGIDLTAGVDDDVVVLPGEQPEQFFERTRVLRARPIELIGARQDVEPRLVLDHQLLEELAVEPVQVVDRIENGEPGTDPEEQRHFAEPRFQVEDNGRPLAQTSDLDGTVDAKHGRPRPALRAEEHQRRRRRPRALRGLAACRDSRSCRRPTTGSAVCAIAKMPACGAAPRIRSMFDMADDASPQTSTTTMSGAVPSRAIRSSVTPTGIGPDRSRRSTCFLNPSFSLTMSPTSCAMCCP